MIDYNFPTRRDKLAMDVAKYAVLWAARDKDDHRGKNEFQADKLIEEGWVQIINWREQYPEFAAWLSRVEDPDDENPYEEGSND